METVILFSGSTILQFDSLQFSTLTLGLQIVTLETQGKFSSEMIITTIVHTNMDTLQWLWEKAF